MVDKDHGAKSGEANEFDPALADPFAHERRRRTRPEASEVNIDGLFRDDAASQPTPSSPEPANEITAIHRPNLVDKEPEQPKKRGWGRRILGGFAELAVVVVGALVISILIRTFLGQMFVIPSGSMQNTLTVGDRVMVAKFGGFQRGDIVVFKDPGGWLRHVEQDSGAFTKFLQYVGFLPEDSGQHLIKRVVGMPGDHLECCSDSGRLLINDHEIDEAEYLFTQDGVQVAPATVPFEVIVPKDHIFVMGDHRNASGDSRCKLTDISQGQPPGAIAFVPVDKVVGASVAIVAPFDRWRSFTVPKAFEAVPDPKQPAPEQAKIISASPGC